MNEPDQVTGYVHLRGAARRLGTSYRRGGMNEQRGLNHYQHILVRVYQMDVLSELVFPI